MWVIQKELDFIFADKWSMEYLQSDLGEIKISNWKMVLEDICKYANVSDNGATAMFITF